MKKLIIGFLFCVSITFASQDWDPKIAAINTYQDITNTIAEEYKDRFNDINKEGFLSVHDKMQSALGSNFLSEFKDKVEVNKLDNMVNTTFREIAKELHTSKTLDMSSIKNQQMVMDTIKSQMVDSVQKNRSIDLTKSKVIGRIVDTVTKDLKSKGLTNIDHTSSVSLNMKNNVRKVNATVDNSFVDRVKELRTLTKERILEKNPKKKLDKPAIERQEAKIKEMRSRIEKAKSKLSSMSPEKRARAEAKIARGKAMVAEMEQQLNSNNWGVNVSQQNVQGSIGRTGNNTENSRASSVRGAGANARGRGPGGAGK